MSTDGANVGEPRVVPHNRLAMVAGPKILGYMPLPTIATDLPCRLGET